MSNTAYRDAGVVDAGEPVENQQNSAEMHQIAEEKLELLGDSLVKTRDKWIAARVAAGVERRWIEDLDQYLGRDDATKQAQSMMDNVLNGPTAKKDKVAPRSTVFVNITRPKTNAVEARLANMLYPSDDKAWGIRPTPNPVLVRAALEEARALAQQWQSGVGAPAQGPQPMQNATPAQVPGVAGGMQPAANPTVKMPEMDQMKVGISALAGPFIKTQAQAEIDTAYMKAKAMEAEIEDALVECDFAAEARKMLHDVAVLGTGVMKGPIVVNRLSKVWEPIPGSKEFALKVHEEKKPASERVSPWDVIPDPSCGTNIHNGKGIFERKLLTAKMLRDLVGQPGYKIEQIKKVLASGPRRSTSNTERDMRNLEQSQEPMYEGWEYWGEFEPEDLRACGVDVPDDSPKTVSGCIIMVNDIVIKGFLNPLECGSLPYDFMVMEQDDNSPFGFGVPFLCRPAQRVLNAAWRQLMDNAGLSVGPITILKPNLIQPADGNWQLTGRKVFNCTDDAANVSEAITLIDIPNHSEQYEKIIQLAMMFADEESSVPKIVQGGQQSDSVGVTTIQMNSANVVLGRLVKQYDDSITRKHIRRYYDFFMAYSEKAEIKGDFHVDARGTSVLLVKDQQVQSLMQFGQFQGSPVAPMVHWHKWLREIIKAQNLNPQDLLKSDAEIEQLLNQPPPPNPEQAKSDTAIKVAEIKADAQLQTAKARESGELAFAEAQAQMARDNAISRVKELEMKRDLEILKYAEQSKQSLEQVRAQLAQTAMIEETKRQVAAAKMEMESLHKDKDRMTANQSQPQGEANG